jgi:predicted transcriptional regulator
LEKGTLSINLLIVKAKGSVTIPFVREAARRVGRDFKAMYGDVSALFNAGTLSKTDDGLIVFLYDAIHVDFMLKAA